MTSMMKKAESKAPTTDRSLKSLKGKSAFSFLYHCQATKMGTKAPKTAKQAMTAGSLHFFWFPPHERARTKQVTNPSMIRAPIHYRNQNQASSVKAGHAYLLSSELTSSPNHRFQTGRVSSESFSATEGLPFKKKTTEPIVIAPMGRLM